MEHNSDKPLLKNNSTKSSWEDVIGLSWIILED